MAVSAVAAQVMKMTGMRPSMWRIRWYASSPDRSGRCTSSRMTSGGPAATWRSPSAAVRATSIRIPWGPRAWVSWSRIIAGSSSTSSNRPIFTDPGTEGPDARLSGEGYYRRGARTCGTRAAANRPAQANTEARAQTGGTLSLAGATGLYPGGEQLMNAPVPEHETERLAALRGLDILDTPPE